MNADLLKEAMNPTRKISQALLAKKLGVHRNTLREKLKENSIDTSFSDISDDDLDQIVRVYRDSHPNSGMSYLRGHVKSQGLLVQRWRLRKSIQRVDRLGQTLRRRAVAKKTRTQYHVSRLNALWHIDGHHKLILWGIVIHGVVDGYSRKVLHKASSDDRTCIHFLELQITGLRASTNNRASTVLEMFMDAIIENGVPSRVRGDRGGENRDVSILMIILRGLNRASFMWGSSIFNTRIERLWVEVGRLFARAWRAFFRRLERLHLLDRSNKHHLWLLHLLFLDAINSDCREFQSDWNSHPISGEGHHRSPNVNIYL